MAGAGAWVGPLCFIITINIALAAMLPPRLSADQSIVEAIEGQTGLVLQCNLDFGDDPIAYRWLKNQVMVTGALAYGYRGYREVLLALHAIQPQHAGTYTCEASNEAGVHTATITVNVDSTISQPPDNTELPHTDEILSNIATSLSDLLAEGECQCDTLFLLHATPDAPLETLAAQANLVHIMADSFVSPNMRVSVLTYSDYVDSKLSFGRGVNKCALRNAFTNLSHKQWPTRIQQVLREVFKKFRKSKANCKVLFLPIFGSLGTEGADTINAQQLKKLGVKIFVLEVTEAPLAHVEEMASMRGDGQPYYWRVPLKIWRTIVINMKYMKEELGACPPQEEDVPGRCVGVGKVCSDDSQCRGAGFGCSNGLCRYLECNINSRTPGCCSNNGHHWCGDVTSQCTGPNTICDGQIQCMNGADESRCWANPCPQDKVARCQTSTLCLELIDLCNGEPECPGGEDEDPRFCRSFPCPRDRPFRCRSGKCISKESLCDGVFKDCNEGEDEDLDYCNRVHICSSARSFKCDYGICIPDRMVCDGSYNCLDASDELVCGRKHCPADRPFKCLRSGLCIGMAQVCNGVHDGCDDGSDEHNCTVIPCPVNRSYKCSSGKCINGWLACDGNDDCGDGSDEFDCDDVTTTTTSTSTTRPEELSCSANEFLCLSGACIPEIRVCDGRRNCLDGDDETDCHDRPCLPSRPHRCQDGTCVVFAVPCDDIRDCGDGSDEINCTHTESDYTLVNYEDEEYNYNYNDYEGDYETEEEEEEEPVLATPSEAPATTPPMMPKETVEHETVLEDQAVHEPEPEPEREGDTVIENPPNNSDEEWDIKDLGTILEDPEPEPETEPEPADVQTAASSEQGVSGGTCTAPLCVPLVLAPIIVLGLCNAWMR